MYTLRMSVIITYLFGFTYLNRLSIVYIKYTESLRLRLRSSYNNIIIIYYIGDILPVYGYR